MRNPNGYGSVVKLSGNRRRPYCARRTIGFNEKGHPIYKAIGYYATQDEALIALAQYNKTPYDLDLAKITLKGLYELLMKRDDEKQRDKFSKSTKAALRASFKKSEHLWNVQYREIKAFHMQEIVDGCGLSYATQGHIKTFFTKLDELALELDIVSKTYSSLIRVDPVPETSKKPFTEEEIKLLWEHKDEPFVDSVLVLLYSGWRINEFLSLKRENVNIEEGWFKGGSKTRSGKDRIVPIHSKIFDIVKRQYEKGNEFLFDYKAETGKKSFNYYDGWNQVMQSLGMEHTPHECRHTFRSRLDAAGANKVSINLMMGHKSSDVGEKVYTHKTIEQLREAIEMIK